MTIYLIIIYEFTACRVTCDSDVKIRRKSCNVCVKNDYVFFWYYLINRVVCQNARCIGCTHKLISSKKCISCNEN